MVRYDRDGWRISGWFESAKEILEQAMNADGKAQQCGEALINYLGRRGHTDFGELLG